MRILIVAAALTSSTAAFAISSYQVDIPNGDAFRCLMCHESAGGGEGWNDFGKDILEEGGANPDANPGDQDLGFVGRPSDYWAAVCGIDSDGDGSSNGEELGDPDCAWTVGDPEPDVTASNPGDPDSVPEAPGDPNNPPAGDDEAGGCAAAGIPASAAGLLGILALAGRRRRQR